MIINSSSIENIDLTILEDIPSKTLIRKFGLPNDFIELNVFDLNGNLIINDPDFKDYQPVTSTIDANGLFKSIDIDFVQVLKDYGLTNGIYKSSFSFQRRQITSDPIRPFTITEISPSRTEIRATSNILTADSLRESIYILAGEINSSTFIKDINLNLGNSIYNLALNVQLDTTNNTFLVKLYDPLPPSITTNTSFGIIEEIINPLEVTINLGESTTVTSEGTPIKGPNFNVDFRVNSPIPSQFKSFDNILEQGVVTSSYNNIQNIISGSIPIDLDFDNPNTPSGYTFENFIHFSSAVERLENFNYKLQLIETYENEISILDTITGDVSASVTVVGEKSSWNNKINNIIQGFDYYERYLYFESGTYAWPKSDSTKPYTNVATTSTKAISWLGTKLSNGFYSNGQLKDASLFDDYNPYKLTNNIPEHIINNPDNAQYITFVEMIAQHFDRIWVYIDNITDINQADSSLKDGISKDLVYNALTQRGIPAFDQFKDANLYEYFIGDVKDGTFQYTSTDGTTMVSASNDSSLPKGDITKEVWKRLYHNAPYLLKTKGTERGIKALLSCYGIPESILHVKEYGGPLVDKTGFRTFTYQKQSKMYKANSNTSYILSTVDDDYASSGPVKTVQFRHLPPTNYAGTFYDIAIFNNNSIVTPSEPSDIAICISQSIDNTILNSGSFAHLVLVSGSNTPIVAGDRIKTQSASSLGPILNGDVWNISVRFNSGSSEGNTIEAYATNTTFNKNTHILSCSIDATGYFAETGSNPRQIRIGPGIGSSLYLAGGTSGSFQEFRVWKEKLTLDTIVTQSLSPFNYNGNTISSSYESLIYRHPLGSTNKTEFGASKPNYAPNSDFWNLFTVSLTNSPDTDIISIEETHHLTTPDTVGSGMVSDKVRIDNGVIDNNWLSPYISVETNVQDRQPLDYSDLGVFFSPTFEVNEDIIYTLGGFRLDDYIGDPTHYTSGSYPDLKTLRDTYTQKLERKLNFYDYIRTIQFFDHTLFRMIKDFAPAKANLKTGLVIEPHYLERTKLAGLNVDYTQETEHLATYVGTGSLSATSENVYDTSINIQEILSGSNAVLENNAQQNKISKNYFVSEAF